MQPNIHTGIGRHILRVGPFAAGVRYSERMVPLSDGWTRSSQKLVPPRLEQRISKPISVTLPRSKDFVFTLIGVLFPRNRAASLQLVRGNRI